MITGFLSTLGNKLAERWATTLTLPGLLFVILAAAGHSLGQAHGLDWSMLSTHVGRLATRWDSHPALAVLTVAAVLAAATGMGLAAELAGEGIKRCWLVSGPQWLVRRNVERRLERWRGAHAEFTAATKSPGESDADFRLRRGRLAAERNDIALAPPSRATWIGDRLRVVGLRVEGEYGIDLEWVWPRLWLVLPTQARTAVTAASDAFTAAATRTGWGLFYLALGAATWWPAAVVGVILVFSGWRAGRAACETLASLVESSVDMYAANLASRLGTTASNGQLSAAVGRALTEHLRKGA